MSIKNFFTAQDQEQKDYYWSVILEQDSLQAAMWRVTKASLQILSVSSATPWDDENLIDSTDAALSSAVQSVPEDAEPSKTVFGLPSSWVKQNQITEEKLEKIKKICKELSLNPVGFVVIGEAIAHLYKLKEDSPFTGILVGLRQDSLEISIFKYGDLTGTTDVARSVSIPEDIKEGLARFSGGEPLPSRILVYDGKSGDLEEAKNLILEADWTSSEPRLLHTPKVEIIIPEDRIKAVSLAGASELTKVTAISQTQQENNNKEQEEQTEHIKPVQEVESSLPTPKPKKVKDDDSKKDLEIQDSRDENIKPVSQTALDPSEAGFVFDTGQKDEQKNIPDQVKINTPATNDKEPNIHPSPYTVLPPKQQKENVLSTVLHKFKLPGLPHAPDFIRRGALLFIGALILIAIAASLAWYTLPKASVTIYVSSQKLQQDTDVTVDTSLKTLNVDDKLVPGQLLSTQVSGEKTKSATGTKTVGEKAAGQVTIRNGTSQPLQLTDQTILFGPSDLQFTADESASVSAALSPSEPGTKTLPATAQGIGAEYNIAKGETFKVGNYPKSEVDAISDDNFSGGSSREISAVTEQDREGLLEELTDELEKKGKEDLLSQISDTDVFIEETVSATPQNTEFSAKVGDEAQTLKLTLGSEVEGVSVRKEDLLQIALNQLKDKVPDGFSLSQNQIKMSFEITSTEANKLDLTMRLRSNLLPSIDPDQISQKISGKSPEAAKQYLQSVPGFARAQITSTPALPGFLGYLPRKSSNINIEMAADN